MFGIGPQDLLIVGALVLLVFGPIKAAGMARELGRFVSGASRTVEEFRSELASPRRRSGRPGAPSKRSRRRSSPPATREGRTSPANLSPARSSATPRNPAGSVSGSFPKAPDASSAACFRIILTEAYHAPPPFIAI
ncbi:MAG: twin-arginine translocase TatA/TatE family subunit [Chloroflexota bacterium]|nr:twin-arginine translocase TatA/TatE family subunit [Chloroflexota bacterium]